jgi:glucarate dehydratase
MSVLLDARSFRSHATCQPTGPGLGIELDPDRVGKYQELYQQLGPYPYIGDASRPGWVPMIPERAWPEPR